MIPEEIARKYAYSRSGYELVGYAECGLPVYELKIQVQFLTHKPISPIDEFTLQAIDAGLTNLDDISSFLGLTRNVIKSVVTDLTINENVVNSGSPDSIYQSLKLTPKGKTVKEKAVLITPEEKIIEINFDGLLREPIILQFEELITARGLRANNWLEIPTINSKRPELEDLNLQKIQKVSQQISRFNKDKQTRRDILSIKEIIRRERKFRYAVALKYKASDGSYLVSFVIDERLNEQYEQAFARGNGISKLKTDSFYNEYLEEITKIKAEFADFLPPEEIVQKLKRDESEAAEKYLQALELLDQATDEETKERFSNLLDEAETTYTNAKAAIEIIPVRSLSVFEHPPILQAALRESTKRLLIISPWLKRRVVDRDFLLKLESLLKDNVLVYIGYGIGDNKNDPAVENDLRQLAHRYSNFIFKKLGDTHAKLLLYDQVCVVLGSFNWLSFEGDPNATFRDEQSFLVTIPEIIDEKFEEQLTRF